VAKKIDGLLLLYNGELLSKSPLLSCLLQKSKVLRGKKKVTICVFEKVVRWVVMIDNTTTVPRIVCAQVPSKLVVPAKTKTIIDFISQSVKTASTSSIMMVLNIIEQREIYFDQSHPILLGQSCTPTQERQRRLFHILSVL